MPTIKYNSKLVKRICSLIEKDSYTVSQICKSVGISESCFYNWQSENSEFRERIAEARHYFTEKMVVECVRSLMKRVKGYEYTEVRNVYVPGKDGQPRIKEMIHTTKHIPPCLPAIIFVLTNKDPEHWKNTFSIEIKHKRSARDMDKIPPYSDARILSIAEISVLNDVELDHKLKELQEKSNKTLQKEDEG